jgi:FAD/FMN-containing dehydrogenase/Fe-S oxidoreductase
MSGEDLGHRLLSCHPSIPPIGSKHGTERMTATQQHSALAAADCEVAFDHLTRQLYATDASLYQIEPLAVAFPRNASQAAAVIRAAADAGLEIIPRGAGTGLAGGAVGAGVVVDFSRHNRQIDALDLERRSVRVGAGVILDQLNDFLKPHGLRFGPDVATSSRATLGGMIANNSSGSHVPFYGLTADHVLSLEIVLADGRIAQTGERQGRPGSEGLDGAVAAMNQGGHSGGSAALRDSLAQLIREHAAAIQQHFTPGLLKRRPGYGLDRFLRDPENLSHLLAGSEGTLAAIASAELKVVPLPRTRGLGLIFFASVADAMQATVELLELKPAAIEHIDRLLFDQTRGQLQFQAARELLRLDLQPCEAILIVEFFDENVPERLALLAQKRPGLRTMLVQDPAQLNLVWSLRKAGLSLLTGCAGPAKPVPGIEDTAVRPADLPAYVAGLQSLFQSLGVRGSFYGHAASGLLHVRPVLDLHEESDRKKLRRLGVEVSALVRQFNGSLSGEHGVGIARTEFIPDHLGPELMQMTREIKAAFDPKNTFNPGKIIPDGRYQIDTCLRLSGPAPQLPFRPVLAFVAKDRSFIGNLEQCNGCGGCRKEAPTMCPTFVATGEEIMSTRGRANAIRAALQGHGGGDLLHSAEWEAVLGNCLSCKACAKECPSNVNLALLKAELLHARHRRDGLSWRERLISSVDTLGRLGCLMPALANAALRRPWLRATLEKSLGFSAQRPLPPYAAQRFDHWFARQARPAHPARGRVILWDDTFVRYHEPHIGIAAVAVLQAARFEVVLPRERRCCGRPAFSQGNLDAAASLGRHNLRILAGAAAAPPILFLEPSCYSMIAEDYQELDLPGAKEIAARCFLFEQFIEELLGREPEALRFKEQPADVAIHAHCHAKALSDPSFMARLAGRLPQRRVTLLDTGCCGMAGAFGALASKYELSLKIAQPLIERIQDQPAGAVIVASGASCRHQIQHLTAAHPLHFAELLAAAL